MRKSLGRSWARQSLHFALDTTALGWATAAVELALVFLWTLVLVHPYLDLDPQVVPSGREYQVPLQSNYFWTRLTACGWCALWDGSASGGSPAVGAPFGSFAHPLVAAGTLVWGVANGAKMAIVAAFLLAGLAQWWLGHELGLGPLARVWSAGMAVSAGHLAGRMETGSLGLVLTTAACSLVLPAILALHRTGSRRAAVMLAIAFAQSAVAGQGYMQVGLLFTLPTAALLLRPDLASIALFARRYALAAGLATLLAAPYLLPVLHFLPELGKHGDPYFRGGQSFAHVPLNLVVADPKFYQTDILGKLPNPFLYSIYVGWIPVLCALAAVFGVRNSGKGPVIAFLAAWAVGALWISTGTPFTLLANAPTSWVAETARGIRHPSVMAGLAVPAILALAAAAVDRAFAARAPRVAFAIGVGETPMRSLSLDLTLLIAIPLIIALADARSFSSVWISTTRLGPELRPVLEALRTPDLQWVQPPYGEQHWIQNAVGMGLKQASNQEPWTWKGHAPPEPVAQASRNGSRPGMTLRNVVDGMPIYTAPEGREYAAVTHPGGGRSVCTARGSGGDIDVGCNLLQPGVLTVKENYWSGWDAYVGGQSAPIGSGQWLEVDLADGVHTIQFRYRPWDVPLGFVLGLAGMGLAIAAWREERPGP